MLGEGGHTLEHVGDKWRCIACRRFAANWETLAPGRCLGLATDRWSATAKRRAAVSLRPPARPHKVVATGDVHWCDRCGAYAELRGKGLARACPGRPRNKWAAQRRTELRAGIHPTTARWLDTGRASADTIGPESDKAVADAVHRGQVRRRGLLDRLRKRARGGDGGEEVAEEAPQPAPVTGFEPAAARDAEIAATTGDTEVAATRARKRFAELLHRVRERETRQRTNFPLQK